MRPNKKETFVRTFVVVKGVGGFPHDMLRYDQAVFYSGEDTGKAEQHREEREVRLFRYSADGRKGCAERWQSFGWTVVSDSGRQLP